MPAQQSKSEKHEQLSLYPGMRVRCAGCGDTFSAYIPLGSLVRHTACQAVGRLQETSLISDPTRKYDWYLSRTFDGGIHHPDCHGKDCDPGSHQPWNRPWDDIEYEI